LRESPQIILPREVVHDMIYYGIRPSEELSFQTARFISPTGIERHKPLNKKNMEILERQEEQKRLSDDFPKKC